MILYSTMKPNIQIEPQTDILRRNLVMDKMLNADTHPV